MNILEEIIGYKFKEVDLAKQKVSIKQMEKSEYFPRQTLSIRNAIVSKDYAIIAEFKRKSPSKGFINSEVSVEEVTTGYTQAGAAGLSVLTDGKFFGGSNTDVLKAREKNTIPILRKEFIVDEYQIIEAKSIGADVILLIAACLSADQIKRFSKLARSLNLEVLLELHDEEEFDKISDGIELVGINNRNLKTFIVDVEQSKRFAAKIPNSFIKIAESGLDSIEVIKDLKIHGFSGFLMGEYFMKSENPAKAFENFSNKLRE